MKEFQKRVITENIHLKDKIDNLVKFIETETFSSLPKDEKGRLKKQMSLMEQYSSVLSERIKSFEY